MGMALFEILFNQDCRLELPDGSTLGSAQLLLGLPKM